MAFHFKIDNAHSIERRNTCQNRNEEIENGYITLLRAITNIRKNVKKIHIFLLFVSIFKKFIQSNNIFWPQSGKDHFKAHLNLLYLILNFRVLKHLFERVNLPMAFCCLSTENHLSFCLRTYTTLASLYTAE